MEHAHELGHGEIEVKRKQARADLFDAYETWCQLDRPESPPAPSAESLPPGVHRAPDGTLLWRATSETPPSGYDALDADGNVDNEFASGWYYALRPVQPDTEPETEPETEHLEWGLDLIGRSRPDQEDPINFVGTDRAYGYCGSSLVWFAKCPVDGTVEVLVQRDGEP